MSGWLPVPQSNPQAQAIQDFHAVVAELRPGDIAIDCGANVGLYTLPMARSGATVHAFEPNPHAFDKLSQAMADFPNVHLYEKAVAGQDGMAKLYLHEFASDDQVKWSTGSSLLGFKGNVREDTFVDVEVIDFVSFVQGLDGSVALIKMDVEGAEVEILERLLKSNVVDRIGRAFVEVHDRKVPELAKRTDRLRATLRERGLTNIDLTWH